jgi:hypothetical protein
MLQQEKKLPFWEAFLFELCLEYCREDSKTTREISLSVFQPFRQLSALYILLHH